MTCKINWSSEVTSGVLLKGRLAHHRFTIRQAKLNVGQGTATGPHIPEIQRTFKLDSIIAILYRLSSIFH